ncbi:MAG: hypothetical protein KQJ78_08420 [Deltaproteobacteria bacterium]|nr:hypothetical protein [Deltaproteobacteria bacterium]
MHKLAISLTITLALALAAGASPAARSAEFENPPVLQASQILPASVVKGPYHTVNEKVTNDGFLNYYQVRSKWRNYQVVSNPALKILVAEFPAIAAMEKVDAGDTFAKSVGDSGEKMVKGVKNLFKDPKGTMEGAGEGLGRLFDRGEEMQRSQPSQYEDSRGKQISGFSNSKRRIAAKFGVDVYSSNPVLQEQLERLAWADYGGGIGLAAATSVVPGMAGLTITVSGSTRLLNDVIDTTPPAELRIANRQHLLQMGVDPDTTELFINNSVFTPRQQTGVVAALENLSGVADRPLLIKVGNTAHTPLMAGLMAQASLLQTGYHQNVTPLKDFAPVARVYYATSKKGALVVNLPLDYVIWSARLAGLVQGLEEKMGPQAPKEFWITGRFSPRAAKELESRGWKLYPASEQRLFGKQK